MPEQAQRSTITVRGVDKQLYEELVRLARETGRNIGDLLNIAMKLLLANVRAGIEFFGRKLEELGQATQKLAEQANVIIVEGVDELSVSKKDLLDVGKPVAFKGLKRLVFSDDIDRDVFEKYVDSIVAVDEVIVPETIPKLIVASKCRLVKRIVTK